MTNIVVEIQQRSEKLRKILFQLPQYITNSLQFELNNLVKDTRCEILDKDCKKVRTDLG